jgi:hypothetical protein
MLPPMGLPESGDFVGVPVIPSEGIITSSFVDLEGAETAAQLSLPLFHHLSAFSRSTADLLSLKP